jgi:hypothetical protein
VGKRKKVNLKSLSIRQKMVMIERIYIWYPKLKRIRERMDYCREFSKIASEPKGILITGNQGAGKTKLIERYLEGFPRVVTTEKVIVPVLAADVIVPATVKSLVGDLLAALGDPAADKGTVASQTRRLCTYLKKCETQIIILDEFQHFKDRESLKVLKNISDWLKILMNRTKLPIILIGMPNSSDVLDVKGNEQLKRRLPWRESLDSFGWGNKDTQQNEMRSFLAMLDEALAGILPRRSNLSDVDTAYLIHKATDGVIDRIMKLVRHAAEVVLLKGLQKIDVELLAEAYEEQLANDIPDKPNPFHVPIRHAKDKEKEVRRSVSSSTAPISEATSKRVRGRQKELPLSVVLSQR